MRRRGVVMCVAAMVVLTGCAGPEKPPLGTLDCGEGAHATVSATGSGGRHWQTRLPEPTEQPPQISGGYVLVRHPCGFTLLDLVDGDVVRTGSENGAVGVAGGFVYSVKDLVLENENQIGGYAVVAEPVVGQEVPGVGGGMTATYAERVWARIVDESLYIVSDERRLERRTATGVARWETTLPVLRNPVIVHVGDVVVVTSTDGSVYGVRGGDGKVLWRQTVDTMKVSYLMSVRPRGSAVVVTARPGAGRGPDVFALDAATGSRLPGSPRADPKEPRVIRADGWSVSIESEQIARQGK